MTMQRQLKSTALLTMLMKTENHSESGSEESLPIANVEFADEDASTSVSLSDEVRRLKEALECKEREVWKTSGERDALERTLAKFIDNMRPVVAFHEAHGMIQEKLDKIKVLEQRATKQEEEIQRLKGDLESSKTQIMELSPDKEAQVHELKAILQEKLNKIEVLEQQGANQQEETQRLKSQLEFKAKKVEEWKVTVVEKHDMIELLGKRGTRQEEEIERLKGELESETLNVRFMQQREVSQRKEIQRLFRQLENQQIQETHQDATAVTNVRHQQRVPRLRRRVIFKHIIRYIA
jgi:chromosome segregation ATPase